MERNPLFNEPYTYTYLENVIALNQAKSLGEPNAVVPPAPQEWKAVDFGDSHGFGTDDGSTYGSAFEQFMGDWTIKLKTLVGR